MKLNASKLKLIIQLSLVAGGIAYLIFTTFSLQTLLILAVISICSLMMIVDIAKKIHAYGTHLTKIGIINLLPKRIQSILLQKSIIDIYSNIVYIPYISKIIGAFIHAFMVKPKPEQLQSSFQDLDQDIQNKIATKGLLSLAPDAVEKLILPRQGNENGIDGVEYPRPPLPQKYGKVSWEWDNRGKYEQLKKSDKIHDRTLGKKVIEVMDSRIGWEIWVVFLVMSMIGANNMRKSKLRAMFVQNGTFFSMLFTLIFLLIKIRQYLKRKDQSNRIDRQPQQPHQHPMINHQKQN